MANGVVATTVVVFVAGRTLLVLVLIVVLTLLPLAERLPAEGRTELELLPLVLGRAVLVLVEPLFTLGRVVLVEVAVRLLALLLTLLLRFTWGLLLTD